MKILLCFGTRPEAIKMVPIIHELTRRNISFRVCVTAQHREMLDQMLQVFKITPDYDLNLMKVDQSLNQLSAEIFKGIDPVLEKEKPNLVIVQGDTTTATIIAQASFHRKINVAHVEAGLRTYKSNSPYPEEINRQIISRIATWHFTPTKKATQNLLNEGVNGKKIFHTGNTVVDTLKLISDNIDQDNLSSSLNINFLAYKKVILVTGHRRENFGEGIKRLCRALVELAKHKEYIIVFPVHLNPEIKLIVEKTLEQISNIRLLPPLNYPEMIFLLKKCDLVISDSGGIQEEAPTFKKPVLVTREFTEREEAVEAGFSILTGTNSKRIVENALRLLKSPPKFENIENPFGDGKAAERIVDFLESQTLKA